MIPIVYSIKAVERQYSTGEEPILVLCSDKSEYICKYAKANGAAFKLASEMIGSLLAQSWGLKTPPTAFVNLRPGHWYKTGNTTTLAFGSKRIDKVIDVNPTTVGCIRPSVFVLFDILNIALFDIWIANEDRNANNANLMYDIEQGRLVSIDYGCIFNTAMYDYPMSQLTSTDTILASELFHHIQNGQPVEATVSKVIDAFLRNVDRCRATADIIMQELPNQWGVSANHVQTKLNQLTDNNWCKSALTIFKEYLSENIS